MSAFRNPAARDAAWSRWYSRQGARPTIERAGRWPLPTQTNNERKAQWASRYYALPMSARLAGVE